MEVILEVLGTIFAELLGPLLIELLAEFGIRSISHTFGLEKVKSAFMSLAGHCLLAAMLATLSLFITNQFYIKNPTFQLANLFITPIIIGFIMRLRGGMLKRNEREVIKLNQFWYGLAFAFTFMLIRYLAITYYIGPEA
jgi:hypothetical protein